MENENIVAWCVKELDAEEVSQEKQKEIYAKRLQMKSKEINATQFLLDYVWGMPENALNHLCWYIKCDFLWRMYLDWCLKNGLLNYSKADLWWEIQALFPQVAIRQRLGTGNEFTGIAWKKVPRATPQALRRKKSHPKGFGFNFWD